MDLPDPREGCEQLGRMNIASPDVRGARKEKENEKESGSQGKKGKNRNLSLSDKWGRWWFYSFQKRNIQKKMISDEPQTNPLCDLTRLSQ